MSRKRRTGALIRAVSVALTALTAGCATAEVGEVQRLRARAAYERGLGHICSPQSVPAPDCQAEPALALAAFREAVAADPEVAPYWNALGWLYLQLGQPALALEQFQRAARLDDTWAEAHLNVGVALAESGRWQEAVDAYRKALSLPTMATPHTAYQNLGVALFHLGRTREAEEALRLAIRLDPKLGTAYYGLGLVLTAQGRTEEARAVFRHARDLAPGSAVGRAAVERLKALGEGG